ncbi:cyclin E2 [Capsaspora owczarzaki ATCC 30864]|uniref:Cyclin E2 n=1 Tax=Capsaspora owczarzaki (strain ATCC 30864) TaxID=595528 RepID=A0A0D2U6B9_CAPO3|nr:cyclin E2 [Capsaspora owczarzaki ATCC 30864]KJE90681.1 cyclin E2 [Capsaspora owczarzaki ATCC 30864]|eukprot:XP_004364819.2 cyclin E2 [Capsaspora owczarzaki ATCC 30864]
MTSQLQQQRGTKRTRSLLDVDDENTAAILSPSTTLSSTTATSAAAPVSRASQRTRTSSTSSTSSSMGSSSATTDALLPILALADRGSADDNLPATQLFGAHKLSENRRTRTSSRQSPQSPHVKQRLLGQHRPRTSMVVFDETEQLQPITIDESKLRADEDEEELLQEHNNEPASTTGSDLVETAAGSSPPQAVAAMHSRLNHSPTAQQGFGAIEEGFMRFLAASPAQERPAGFLRVSDWISSDSFHKNQIAEIYDWLKSREEHYVPASRNFYTKHPTIIPRMRAILIDWMKEVCEEYGMHRETFHLAAEFVDRYLHSSRVAVDKNNLQLIGTTCMLIASKLEEVRPPVVADFAYVTDSACTALQIVENEMKVLMTLNWELCPITVNAWVAIFLQIATLRQKEDVSDALLLAQASPDAYTKIMTLLDVAILDNPMLEYSPSLVATAGLFVTFGGQSSTIGAQWQDEAFVQSVTGYTLPELESAISWLQPIWMQICVTEPLQRLVSQFARLVPESDQHNLQTKSHDISILSHFHSPQHRNTY